MNVAQLRSWWMERQGLPQGWQGDAPREALARSGWARSVGGSNPYLTLFARTGASRADAERAASEVEIQELPSARGCTYVVPREDFALALTLGQSFSEAGDLRTAKKHLGVTEEELALLADKVLQALSTGPLDPAELRAKVGDAARNLGTEGKKRGTTTTLPLVLGRLQSHGEIRRIPVGNRLDNQRFSYSLWPDNPLKSASYSEEEAYRMLAERYFRWIGPATLANFRWFSGLGVKAAQAAMAPLGLVPVEDGGDWLMFPQDREEFLAHRVSKEPQIALVSSLDAILLHRRDLSMHLDEGDCSQKIRGEKGLVEIGHLMDLTNNAILDRGRIVGLWEYDVETQSIAWTSFVEPHEAIRKTVERSEMFIRDQLGDARSFSLDSPESRRPKIEALRAMSA